MPKNTFFHLSEEKRKRIMDAAYALLQDHRYADISINMIIKKAEIPRGSFYQYFDGLEDLVRYMFTDIRKEVRTAISKCLREDQNLLDGAVDILENIAEIMENANVKKVFSNILSDTAITEMFINDMTEDENLLVEELKNHVDRSSLRFESDHDIEQLIRLGLSLFEYTAGEIFKNVEKKDEIIHNFKVRADIVAYGALKDRKGR